MEVLHCVGFVLFVCVGVALVGLIAHIIDCVRGY